MKRILSFLCLVVLALSNVKGQTGQANESYIFIQPEDHEKERWQVVWQDDFDGPRLDSTKWTKIPPNKADWGRHMTDDPRCYDLRHGKLYLRGIVNPDTATNSRRYLTGGIYSKGKFAWQYGRIEIRARLECARGAWPAIWMLAEQRKYGGYPRNGEIDIMEHLNHERKVYQTVHSYYTLVLGHKKDPPHHATARIRKKRFNTYGLEWYRDSLVFTVNGRKNFTYPKVDTADVSQWPFDQPFHLLIDQQLGGQWVGKIKPKQLPVNMIIDWVKVYQ